MSQKVEDSVPSLSIPTDLNTNEVKALLDEIFESAQSNSWDHDVFSKKILSGCVASNLGYVAIALELIHTATGLKHDSAGKILLFFVAQTTKLDTVSINKAHLLFEHGLMLKFIEYKQEQEAL